MAYTPKDGSGSLFTNDKKEKENHPDYKGSIMIDGREYWLSGWKKKNERGTFLSLAAQPKDKADQKPKAQPKPEQNFIDDDLPF